MLLRAAFVIALVTAAPAAAVQDLQARAEALLVETGVPGVGIAVFDAGEIRVAVAGERAAGSGVAVEPGDPWHIGSDTKSVTATLAARLVEQGVLSWDDTVAERLGDTLPRIRDDYADQTFRHLLSHRAGLPANLGFVGSLRLAGTDAGRDAAADRVRYARWILRKPPAAAAETEFLYSNAGYVVAGAMIEAATGETYEDLVRREVFAPLGLDSAGFGPPGSAETLDAPRGHRNGRPVAPGARADNPPAMSPAGRAHMSLADIARYLGAHAQGARGGDFLSAESWATLHAAPFGGDYALGWRLGEDGALRHAGSNTMWFVMIAVWPDLDRAAVVAANDGRFEDLRDVFEREIDALKDAGAE